MSEQVSQPFEEGEIKVIDGDNYIISDRPFHFHWDDHKHVNWRSIGALHFDERSGVLDNSQEPANDILLNIE